MKCPKYGEWCKKTVIATVRKQIINESKEYLEKLVFNPYSDLYSIYEYGVPDILWIINGDPDNPTKSLFTAVQHEFDQKYFQMAQKINPEMDMKDIMKDSGESLDLLYETFEKITIEQLKGAVMYAFDHGTEEVKESKIPYLKTTIGNITKIINSGIVVIESVSINYVNPNAKREDIPIDKFMDYLMHFNQSGIFADTINWRYTDLFDNGSFLIEGDIGHNNGYELNVSIDANNKEDKDKVIEILKGRKE